MPELRRYTGYRTAFDAGVGGWLAAITLPSLALGAVVGPTAALVQANAERLRLPPTAARYVPVAVGAALLLPVLQLSAVAAEGVMDFAVRPLLDATKPEGEGADGHDGCSTSEARPASAQTCDV